MRLTRRGRTAPVLGAVLAALALSLGAAPAHAADEATIDNAQPGDGVVKLLVTVPGTATPDVTNVAVTVDGKDADATAVPASQTNDVVRTTILAIDTSDSMKGDRIAGAKAAANAYLASVPANVKVGLVTFAQDVTTVVAPTLDRAATRTAVAGLQLSHYTALYRGVLGAIDTAGDSGQRKILVLSDGKDTTSTPLDDVVASIKASDVAVDVVSLQQQDADNKPLNTIAEAGRGEVIDTQDPSALSATFASEASDLARQVLVTAKIPSGKATSGDVAVSISAGGAPYTAAAYVPVRTAPAEPAVAPTAPVPGPSHVLQIPKAAVYAGVAAVGVALLGSVLLIAGVGQAPRKKDSLLDQMKAYGASSPGTNSGHAQRVQQLSVADQAKEAAARALAANEGLEARIAARLDGAGTPMKPAEWLLLHAGIALGLGLLGFLIGGGSALLCLVLLLVGVIGPWVYLGIQRSRRLKAFNTHLADTLQLMSGSLSAGLSLAQSIDTIVREGTEPISSEFRRVVIESRLGVTLEDSLDGVAERMQSKDFQWVVMAIRIQREVGGNLAELLLTVAATLRERDYLRRHVRALSAEGRLSCWILGGLPPGFLVYLSVSKPDYVKPMYTTPIGWVLVAGMAMLLSVGVFWMSKVAKVDV